ncbi:hypothetical protein Bca52824_001252 [Brassica carinata]|uniref:Uncharacterized protein n=1 Tax=Brassica carinata TaxID=52824 RepID=A0A8X8BDQ2_BRACI|nr:hypothetical protein Bca52824_001252 [Brassica carinata]
MDSYNYFRSWMDQPHMDPNTNLLTEEYARGVQEFMALVEQLPEAPNGASSTSSTPFLPRDSPAAPSQGGQSLPTTMDINELIRQPGREALPRLHPDYKTIPNTTWFGLTESRVSKSLLRIFHSGLLPKGWPTYAEIPRNFRDCWFRQFAEHLHSLVLYLEVLVVLLLAFSPRDSPAAPSQGGQSLPTTMDINELIRQPGREALPRLHPDYKTIPNTTWFGLTESRVSKSLLRIFHSGLLPKGWPTYAEIPRNFRDCWFRQFAENEKHTQITTSLQRFAQNLKTLRPYVLSDGEILPEH